MKKRKHHKYTSDSVDRCDQLTDCINHSADGDESGLCEHGTETLVDSQSEQQAKKSRKRKRSHDKEDVFDKQKHCKYQKVKGDSVSSVQLDVQKQHHNVVTPGKHSSEEKLPNRLFSSTPPDQCRVNGQQQEKCKKRNKVKMKKKKKRELCALTSDKHRTSELCALTSDKHRTSELCALTSDKHRTSDDADCKQLRKRKKKKKSKKKSKDIVSHDDFSNDLPKQCSPHLLVSSDTAVSSDETAPRDALTNTCEGGHQVLSVSKLEVVTSDEMKYVEHVYEEHKSRKTKHRRLKVNTSTEAETANSCPVVVSTNTSRNTCSEIHDQSKSVSEQDLNAADVLKLLHGENSLYYLRSKAEVKEAGEKLEMTYLCCMVVMSPAIIALFRVVHASIRACLHPSIHLYII